MKKYFCLILCMLLLVSVCAAAAEKDAIYTVDKANNDLFVTLTEQLQSAFEEPAEGDSAAIAATVAAIRSNNPDDGDIAEAIAQHWTDTYRNPDYVLYCHTDGEKTASALEEADLAIGARHAIVILGFELKNGEMQDELKARCLAGAAAAETWPDAILICSGGATGSNNPKKNTEAGLMKTFLVKECGIDPDRIFTDEQAMTTKENAVNTMAILQSQEISTITIVTSDYHQLWGQVLYHAVSCLYEKAYGYGVEIVGNYCCVYEPSDERFRTHDRIALMQLRGMLNVKKAK